MYHHNHKGGQHPNRQAHSGKRNVSAARHEEHSECNEYRELGSEKQKELRSASKRPRFDFDVNTCEKISSESVTEGSLGVDLARLRLANNSPVSHSQSFPSPSSDCSSIQSPAHDSHAVYEFQMDQYLRVNALLHQLHDERTARNR
eukprot:CFRG5861T1